jgi:hypothetical protein
MALPGNPLTAVDGMDAKWSAAAGDLYQTCHLRPPGVLVARDAVDLARLTRLMTPAWNPAPVLLLITLSALLASVVLTLRPDTASLGAFLSADFGLFMVPCCTVLFAPPIGRPSFILCRAGLRLAAVAAAGFIAAWLHGGCLTDDPHTWAVTLGLTGAAFLASDLVVRVCHRRSACARAIGSFRPGLAALSKGFRPVGAVVHERLRSALSDLNKNASNRPHGAPVRTEPQQRTWHALRSELQRLQVQGDALPVLGRSVGTDHDQAARVSAFGLSGADPAELPSVLRAAVTLDGLAAAVCALDGIAIVLPLAAPDSLTAPPAGPGGWRRSHRTHWHAALGFLDEPPAELVWAIDLAPWDGFADRLLAGRITAIEAPARRSLALQAMGMARAATALRLRPVHADSFGRLFHFGDRLDPSAFVAVHDRAVEADGAPIEHWICVPPHMATAREAVAWTFGMSEHEYRPIRET